MNTQPKILIVDDKPENLKVLRTVLQDLDVELVEATSGNEALLKTLHHNFSLALVDIQMPIMDGYELAGILRDDEKTEHLPVIFISAVYTDNLNVFKGYEKGAFSFVTKPFDPEILINKVKFFIKKHQQEIELMQLYMNMESKNNELLLSNEELESFSYSVSHDLRAPLRALHGYSCMLEEDYAHLLDDEGNRILNNIQKNAKRMGLLVDHLLAFSRLGKKELGKSFMDMSNIVHAVLEELKGSVPDKTIIKKNDLLPVHGDSSLIGQVWINLISNAVKFSEKREKPLIEISSEKKENEIIYSINDNGEGFNMEYAHKLFGVFQRLHGQEEFEGTGIGLAIVKRIIAKHGGKVWAVGKINDGATFYFSLPIIST